MGWTELRWTQEINNTLGTTEFQNATINICDPSLVATTWNIDTNTPVVSGSAVLVRGIQARVNWPLRAVTDPGTASGNPSIVRAGRLTIQNSQYSGPIRNGLVFVVTDGGDNLDLLRWVFRIEEGINSSNMASRIMKISVNGEGPEATPVTAAYL